ncbi:hypothetical protein [Haladaptatus sp. DYSN1]|uniref:hypothetical protein n=1 Tax=unclassified Haladaptatus TaxID=2622732 RepID=UPI002405D311|nr:hypothetical protein [Haladaptatus sp. DYSN1]
MSRHATFANLLVVLSLALLITPAFVPVEPVKYHNTHPGNGGNATALEREGYQIIAYENLSDRGQELYVKTLENGGRYTVPASEGAPDFPYATGEELSEASDHQERNSLSYIVIERPANSTLPPADEPTHIAEHLEREREQRREAGRDSGSDSQSDSGSGTDDGPTVEEYRQQIAKYDVMQVRTQEPGATHPARLSRFGAVVGGVIALGVGGYLRSKP